MRLVRRINAVTANLGRGATRAQFKDNVDRMADRFDPKRTFYGFQEIDEADVPEEMDYLRKVFGETHRFVGVHTHVPLAIPRTWAVSRSDIEQASDGVAGLQPDRHVVDVLTFPTGLKTKRKLRFLNTHVGRNIPQLQDEREDSFRVLQEHYDNDRPTILMMDANTENLKQLLEGEKRLFTSRLDYIRAIERRDVEIRLLNRGSLPLVGDGHNANFADIYVIWP